LEKQNGENKKEMMTSFIKNILPWLAVIVLVIVLVWPKDPRVITTRPSYIDSVKITKLDYKLDSLSKIIESDKKSIEGLTKTIVTLNGNVSRLQGDLKKIRGDKKNEINKINDATTDELIGIFSNANRD